MEAYLQEVGALTMRWVKRLSREKFSMLFTLFQPMVFWLIFFGNLFQPSLQILHVIVLIPQTFCFA